MIADAESFVETFLENDVFSATNRSMQERKTTEFIQSGRDETSVQCERGVVL